MSRIGNTPITIPDNVTVQVDGRQVVVKGPKGDLTLQTPGNVSLKTEENLLEFKRTSNSKQARANHGLVRSLVQNMIIGTTEGYEKRLELVGTGYRAAKQGKKIVLNVGLSHQVEYEPRDGIELNVEGNNIIIVSGVDKQKVGQTAAEIRAVREPEPYKGKGIRYENEVIRRKAGKAVKAAA